MRMFGPLRLPRSRAERDLLSVERDDLLHRLLALCRKNLDAAPECYLDLVEYYRFTRDKAGLEKQVDAALKKIFDDQGRMFE